MVWRGFTVRIWLDYCLIVSGYLCISLTLTHMHDIILFICVCRGKGTQTRVCIHTYVYKKTFKIVDGGHGMYVCCAKGNPPIAHGAKTTPLTGIGLHKHLVDAS